LISPEPARCGSFGDDRAPRMAFDTGRQVRLHRGTRVSGLGGLVIAPRLTDLFRPRSDARLQDHAGLRRSNTRAAAFDQHCSTALLRVRPFGEPLRRGPLNLQATIASPSGPTTRFAPGSPRGRNTFRTPRGVRRRALDRRTRCTVSSINDTFPAPAPAPAPLLPCLQVIVRRALISFRPGQSA
jgi:hypothetical protein